MKILIFNTLYTPYKVGGAELSVQSLAEGLAKRGCDVGVVTLGEQNEVRKLNGVRVWRLKIDNLFWPFTASQKGGVKKLIWHAKDIFNKSYKKPIQEIISEFHPNIIHTNNLAGFSVFVWDIAKKNKIKTVHTIRDYYLQCLKTTKFRNNRSCQQRCLECKLFSSYKKRASNQVDVVVGLSNYVLEDHVSNGYFPLAKNHVIFNGFDLSHQDKTKKIKIFDREDYIRLGYIGRIETAKGIDLLINSLRELSYFKNWNLSVAGKVTSDIKNQLNKEFDDRINFLGYVKQEFFFNNIDVLVVPSTWEEPFGRVVVEGLIHKKVVIGSKSGGIPQLLEGNEKYLFTPTSIDLTNLLQVVFNNPKYLNDFVFDDNQLKKFDLECIIDEYIEIYK